MPLLRRFWSTDRSLSLLLASLVLVIFVIQPLQATGVAGRLLMALFFSFILISGVAAVAKNTLTTCVVGGVVVATLVIRGLRLWRGGASLTISDTAISSLFCLVLAVVVLAQVFRKGPVTWYRIQGAVAFYLLLGLAWGGAYELIELRWPDAFVPASSATMNQNADPTARFVYFSFVTLTTVGYGDVTAVHPFARALVTLEALMGQLFPAILLARLVSMELFHRQAKGLEHR